MNADQILARELAEKLADDRANRIADVAAEELILAEGVATSGINEFNFDLNTLASDEHLSDCIAHLCWRGLALRQDSKDAAVIMLGDFTIEF